MITDRTMLTIPEAMQRLGISRSQIYRMINRGKLTRSHIGGKAVIPIKAIEAFEAKLTEGESQ